MFHDSENSLDTSLSNPLLSSCRLTLVFTTPIRYEVSVGSNMKNLPTLSLSDEDTTDHNWYRTLLTYLYSICLSSV